MGLYNKLLNLFLEKKTTFFKENINLQKPVPFYNSVIFAHFRTNYRAQVLSLVGD